MAELIVVLIGAGAAVVVWLALRTKVEQSHYLMAASGFGSLAARSDDAVHQWPRLGQFEFEIADTAQHQPALRRVFDDHGPRCVASLHPGGTGRDACAPVEVRVDGLRVGYLADGDATRFHRRLAYESRPGRVSRCDAQITWHEQGRRAERRVYTIQLDLKPFRH